MAGIGADLSHNCIKCKIILSIDNSARNGMRNGKQRFRNACKKCSSKRSVACDKKNPARRRERINEYVRKIGKVKKYPCELCTKECYKIYEKAFCSDICRFMFYVVKTDDCWLWNGSNGPDGYGAFSINGKGVSAHRAAYKLFNGEIHKGMYVCHSCDRPKCVNPSHLWLGTAQDNKTDQIDKERGLLKLKTLDVYRIRELHEKNNWSYEKLSEEFNVTSAHIYSIIKRKRWKHV